MMTNAKQIRDRVMAQAGRAVVGQEETIELLFVALLSGGHVLLEGVPGTAKTLIAKTLSMLLQAQFTRVQFTPDLMPSDILGTSVFDLTTSRFHLQQGPIFTNFLLADEINRAPAKTQAALLEAMEERQVTLDGKRHVLPEPFITIATQNPIEYEGTYPLPEAQIDRFLFKILVDYGSTDEEQEILKRYHSGFDAKNLDALGLEPVLRPGDIAALRAGCQAISVGPGVMSYITSIVRSTRDARDIRLGASPRAGIALLLGSKVVAALDGRDYVLPDDVKRLALPVLRHRVVLRPEVELEGMTPDMVIDGVLSAVEVPR